MITWKLKTRTLRPIGLDIGHNSIKMIQLMTNGSQTSVIAADKACFHPTLDEDPQKRRNFIISAIKQMLQQGSFHGRNVVSCLPSESLKITSLRLAESETRQIEQSLKKEAAQRFGLDPHQDTINYMLAGNVKHGDEVKNELILFAADNETIKSHIQMLEQAQLRPVALDAVPCALFRSFERLLRRHEDSQRSAVFVDVGRKFTTVVFSRGRKITFVKQMPIGGEKFVQEIAARLGVNTIQAETLRQSLRAHKNSSTPQLSASPKTAGQKMLDADTRQVMVDAITAVAEEMAREISLCFRYYTVTFRGKRTERAIFTGGEAYETILLNVLKRQLAVEVEVAQPLKGFNLSTERKYINLDSDRRGLLCEWAVAVGLSLKGYPGFKNNQN